MAIIGNLLVNLGMRTAAFEKGSKRGQNSLRQLQQNVQSTTASFARMATAVISVFAVRRVAGMFSDTARSLDEVSKASRRVGVDAERLMGLQHAADLSGVSAQELNVAMRNLQRRVSEAAQGFGQGQQSLEQLGLSARELAQLTVDEQMKRVADAMANVSNEGDRVAIAMQLFGRSGEGVITMLEQGSGWLEKLMQSMEGVATKEELERVESMRDAFTTMWKEVEKLRARFVVAASQGVERFANAISNLVKHIQQWDASTWSAIGKTIHFTVALYAITKIAKPIIWALKAIAAIKTVLIAKQTTLLALAGPQGWATIAVGVGIAAMAYMALETHVSSMMSEVEGATDAMAEFKQEADKTSRMSLPMLEAADKMHQQRQSLRENVTAIIETTREYDKLLKTTEEWDERLGLMRSQLNLSSGELFDLADWLGKAENRMKFAEAAASGMTQRGLYNFVAGLQRAQAALEAVEREKHIEKMREENEVLMLVARTGMDAARAQFLLAGATREQMAEFDRIDTLNRFAEHISDVREEQEAFADSVQRMTDRLKEQIDTFGMSAGAADLWRMHLKGATDEQVQNLARLMMQIEQLETAQRPTGQRTAGEARVIDRSRIGLEGLRMMGRDQPMQKTEAELKGIREVLNRIYVDRGMSA